MRKVFTLLITITALSCNQNTKSTQPEKTAMETKSEVTENFDWLTGKWKRLDDKDGKKTFENWDKLSAGEYSGFGYTLLKNDTITQEKMSLVQKEGQWSLFVKMPEEKAPTEFKMIEFNSTRFICINDSIDFPKRIEYWVENEQLKAKISNEELVISFEFEKIK